MRILPFAMVLTLVAGCQCLQAVEEDAGRRLDAGSSDAGQRAESDAGASADAGRRDAGLSVECEQPSDCVFDAGPSLAGCRAVNSCNYGRCTPDCDVARRCVAVDAGLAFEASCIDCGTVQCASMNTNCPVLRALQLERSTCASADTLRAIGPVARLPCTYDLAFSDGGIAGTVTFAPTGIVFGDFPFLGGRCVGFEAPTGALRYWLSCPACMASVMPN